MTFPLVVIAQKNAANMANNGPEMQVLMSKVTEARRRGDQIAVAQATLEMKKFHDEKGISFVKNMVPLFVQVR